MLVDSTVKEFVDIVASAAPAPGGGSVAALSGAMSAGLIVMVCNLTLGREKFAAVEAELQVTRSQAGALQQELLTLVDRDTDSFNQVMAAYKLPKDSEQAKLVRMQAIEAAAKQAAEVPLTTAQACWECLQQAANLAGKINPNAITDLGVAAHMAWSGLQGAIYNVLINLSSISDSEYTANAKLRCDSWTVQAGHLLSQVQQAVNQATA